MVVGQMAEKVKFRKISGLVVTLVTLAAFLLLGGRELQRASAPTPGMIAVKAMSQQGLIVNQADWQRTVKAAHQGRDLKTIADINQVLKQANKHSFAVKSPEMIEAINYPSTTKTANFTMINVPSVYALHQQERLSYLEILQKKVAQASQEPGPIVLNFVNNQGGDVVPMIAGLSALIPNGRLWAQVDKHGKQHWLTMTDSQIKQPLSTSYKYSHVAKHLNKKVLVIMNRYTASSGEMAIIVLKQNPNCQIVGTESAGFTSANNLVSLKKDNWAAIITYASLYSPAAIHGRHHFNNEPLQRDVWTTQVPIANPTSWAQQPLDKGFLQELQTAAAS